jgi:hypothetical protein
MSDKLNINNEMAQLDLKNRDFYDSLTDEERKKFSTFLMIRWSSSPRATKEVEAYYVQSCNHYLNKHFFTINRHPKLQWLCATAVSPGIGTYRHDYVKFAKKKNSADSKVKKALRAMYPTMKMSDIEALASITTAKELKEYERELGNDHKD